MIVAAIEELEECYFSQDLLYRSWYNYDRGSIPE
jgi:hypothetical protein